MKTWKLSIVAAALFTLSGVSLAASVSNDSAWIGSGRISHWQAVDRDQLILWVSPSKPYLIEIWRPVRSLRFVHTIGVSTTTGRLTRFDHIIVDGQRLPIKSITALDRETARELL